MYNGLVIQDVIIILLLYLANPCLVAKLVD